ncbi:hypothetical protein, partial [Bartonella henselae]
MVRAFLVCRCGRKALGFAVRVGDEVLGRGQVMRGGEGRCVVCWGRCIVCRVKNLPAKQNYFTLRYCQCVCS